MKGHMILNDGLIDHNIDRVNNREDTNKVHMGHVYIYNAECHQMSFINTLNGLLASFIGFDALC